MAGRRRQVGRSKPSSIERETGNPRSRSGTSAIYAAIAKKAREKKEKEAKAKAAKDKAAKELKQKNAQAAEDKRLKLAAQKEANELARAEAEVNSRRQREDASRRMIQMAEASAKKAKDKEAKEAADKRLAEAKARQEELAAKRAEAEKRRADKEAAAAKASKEREAKAAADKAEIAAANKAAEEKAAKQAARLEQIRILEERDQFRRGEQLQIRQQEAKRIREAKATADAKAASDAKAAEAKAPPPVSRRITGPPTKEQTALAYRLFAENGDRTMLNDITAYNAEMKGIEERSEAKAAEDKPIADANREVKTVEFTADQLVDKYNNSRGAQDFKLTSSYDPKTNTFIEDVSAFGFEGDAATKTYTPEEFIAKLGYKGDDYNQFNFSQPQQQDPAPTPPDTPVSSTEQDSTSTSDGINLDENGDPRKGNEDPSLQNTVAPMWAAQSPDFKFTAEPIPRINPAWKGLEEWKAQQQDQEPTPPDTPPSIFDVDPNMSELDRLKKQYETMDGMRFIVDPGPEHWKGLQALANQIKALDPSFESSWLTSTPAPSPDPEPAPTPPDMPPEYPYEYGIEPWHNYPGGIEQYFKDNPDRDPRRDTSDPSPDPAPTLPDMPVQPAPEPLPESPAPKPPTFVDMDPLKGMRDQFVPRNILGQSYDPKVREDFVRQMQSGANITSTPSYQIPTSPIPQTQFGGYGQPMPMSPLAPYAGLGAAPRPPIDYDEPYDEDALPGGPSGPRDGGGVF